MSTQPIDINFMNKFPCVILFRYDKYSSIDAMFSGENIDKLECAVKITSDSTMLFKLYDPNYPVLVTFGESWEEYDKEIRTVICDRMNKRWVHLAKIDSIDDFSQVVNTCFIKTCLSDRVLVRPVFSIFTTCYNSYEKITRAYESILSQNLKDWEWVILDDSPDDNHFTFLKKKFMDNLKIRLYKRACNSGNIGNVKNEAVSLCRGKYVLEMDHDDEILPHTLEEATRVFESDSEVGFVYMDFINIYENGENFKYGDFISLGYGGYYMEKYLDKWRYVYITPNINNITASHIVAVPNHPRIWRKDTLLKLGNYSEFLPICDDQEILMRTIVGTKMVKIPKLSYVQYMNANNNNFSILRNREINRIGPQFLVPNFYSQYNVHDVMKTKGGYEDEFFVRNHSQVWKRDNYDHKYCNDRILYDYDCQICIISLEAFIKRIDTLKELYENPRNDFILLENKIDKEILCEFLDSLNFTRMKCYSMSDTSYPHLKNYFNYLYKTCENTIIFE